MEQHMIDRISVNRILVIRLALVGDVLLTTPLLSALRTAFPKSFICYLTELPVARDILKSNPDVDECILRTKNILKEIARMQPFDLVLDLFGGGLSQTLCLLSGAKYRLGPVSAEPVGNLQPYTIVTPAISERDHALTDLIRFAKVLGIPDPPLKTVLILNEGERNFAKALLHEYGIGPEDRWLALQPGRRAEEPPWSADKFVALTHKLSRRFGHPILIFQGPKDLTPIAQEICKRVRNGVRLVPVLPIRHYAAVLERCALLVASEGGAGHIAATLGVKTIVIFTMPGKSYWFPYAREHGMLALEELPGEDLAVQDVFSAVEALAMQAF
jgi:ADP-heptose:LPS heptosyltransferase